METPDRDALVRLSRRIAEARWTDKAIVNGEAFNFDLTELGQARLLQLDAILQELGPLDKEEWITLKGAAIVFAKQFKTRRHLPL
jgi:hypothetical protein